MLLRMRIEHGESQSRDNHQTEPTTLPPVWDPTLPIEINLNRRKYEKFFDVMGRTRGFHTAMDPDNNETMKLSIMDRTTFELNCMKNERDIYLSRIATLEEQYPQFAFPPPPFSVLTWMQRYLQIFFSRGSQNATHLYFRMDMAVRCQRTTVGKFRLSENERNQVAVFAPWNSFRLPQALILVLASSPTDMYETLKRYTHTLGGAPVTLAKVRDNPSQSLRAAMKVAEAEACSPQHLNITKTTGKTKGHMPPKITILGVKFIDIGFMKKNATIPGFGEKHTSFSRYFVVGAGPEGFIVWQAGGEGSYALNEYIDRGGDRIRDWSEAPMFVGDFERLAEEKVILRPFQIERSNHDRREVGTQRSTSGSNAALKLTLERWRKRSLYIQSTRLKSISISWRMCKAHISTSSIGFKFWGFQGPLAVLPSHVNLLMEIEQTCIENRIRFMRPCTIQVSQILGGQRHLMRLYWYALKPSVQTIGSVFAPPLNSTCLVGYPILADFFFVCYGRELEFLTPSTLSIPVGSHIHIGEPEIPRF